MPSAPRARRSRRLRGPIQRAPVSKGSYSPRASQNSGALGKGREASQPEALSHGETSETPSWPVPRRAGR
eukprot:4478592-Alexandrium_andersonii.AAC.1